MNNLQVCETNMPEIKVWNGQRVVTFKDIDTVHGRKSGIAKKNFDRNKKHFIENEDYYMVTKGSLKGTNCPNENYNLKNIPPRGMMLLTESGYLMIVKSFTDDLSWDVQRQLVNGYFKVKEVANSAPIALPAQSTSAVPKKRSWYDMNKEKLDKAKNVAPGGIKQIYHKILSKLGKTYDLNAAKEIYKRELGYYPTYAMDIIPYFPELLNEANQMLDELLDLL